MWNVLTFCLDSLFFKWDFAKDSATFSEAAINSILKSIITYITLGWYDSHWTSIEWKYNGLNLVNFSLGRFFITLRWFSFCLFLLLQSWSCSNCRLRLFQILTETPLGPAVFWLILLFLIFIHKNWIRTQLWKTLWFM